MLAHAVSTKVSKMQVGLHRLTMIGGSAARMVSRHDRLTCSETIQLAFEARHNISKGTILDAQTAILSS